MRLRRDSAANRKASFENRKASSENRKVFSEESEGFFRRALGSYTHKFPIRGAASLTYLPRSRLDLPRSRLGLPRLRLSRNSGPATEGFPNRGINFKDAYRRLMVLEGKSLPSLRLVSVTYKESQSLSNSTSLQHQGRIQDFVKGGARYFTSAHSADQSMRSAEKIFRLHFPVVWMGCRGTFVVCTASSRCVRIDAAYAHRETSSSYRLSGHVPGQGRTSTIDSGGMPPT